MKKKIILVSGVVIAMIIISCASIKSKKASSPQNSEVSKLEKIAPQLVRSSPYANIVANVGRVKTSNQNPIESNSHHDLVGTITNKFGIRDDILDYIFTTIPKGNTGALVSAIKIAQNDQQEMFVKDSDKLNKLEDKGAAAVWCLGTYLDGNSLEDFVHGYDKLMRNTPERKALQESIENKLGGHVISVNFGFKNDTWEPAESICSKFINQ
jgi:hypothetical protein